jgi:DeoR/GlpR family transcriptional regulator of sugar metabolism
MADEPKVEPKKAAVRAASETVLVAASSKYGTFGRYRVLGLDELDVIITDDGLSAATAGAISELGVSVERVAPGVT